MKKRTNVLIWSALASLVLASVYLVVNETVTKPSFVDGVAIGGVLAGAWAYGNRRKGPTGRTF